MELADALIRTFFRDDHPELLIPPLVAHVVEYFLNTAMVDWFDVKTGQWKHQPVKVVAASVLLVPHLVDRLCTHAPHQWNIDERVQVHHKKSWHDAIVLQRRFKDDLDPESLQFKTSVPPQQWIGLGDMAIRPWTGAAAASMSDNLVVSQPSKAPTVWELAAERIEAQRRAWRRGGVVGAAVVAAKKKKKKKAVVHGPNLGCDQRTVRSGRVAIVTKPTTELDFSL